MFSEKDLKQFKEKGIAVEQVTQQVENFRKGFPYMNIVKAATVNDGIKKPGKQESNEAVNTFETHRHKLNLLKFVPASGAATRMFKVLFAFLNDKQTDEIDSTEAMKNRGYEAVYNFFNNLGRFAFYEELQEVLHSQGYDLEKLMEEGAYKTILRYFLQDGLEYGKRPKGLLKFHRYKNTTRTPLEEHLVEAANYTKSGSTARLHFTVSPEHQKRFENLIDEVKDTYEAHYQVSYEIDLSQQKPYTDTLAVDLNNEPFRNEDGSILFRPGGHGALIENLNELKADIVFIKNIDNVVPDKLKASTFRYKKLLAGLLIQYQQKVFDYLRQLQSVNGVSMHLLEEISHFMVNKLHILPADKFEPQSHQDKINYMIRKLNRPIRVCGMVKNEGEPGGGPFWAANNDGTVSLHIVEQSQIDPDDEEKQELVRHATHFNPVDLVCGIKDYMGNKFDLKQYVDPSTGFISEKSKDGRALKAQELPGLWNGAMSDWITLFAEVPAETFNPVKTINDLLRVEHQANNIH